MAAVSEQNVIVTSYDVISRGCGPQCKHFWMYYLSFKFRCHSFNILGVKRWGRPPRSHKTKKSPVWIGLILCFVLFYSIWYKRHLSCAYGHFLNLFLPLLRFFHTSEYLIWSSFVIDISPVWNSPMEWGESKQSIWVLVQFLTAFPALNLPRCPSNKHTEWSKRIYNRSTEITPSQYSNEKGKQHGTSTNQLY